MVMLTIDGAEIEISAAASIIQACDLAGIEIPRFCYHERLSIAGNCRMCLVEMVGASKPVAACALPVAEGMTILTASPLVRAARRGVMEFLLINHPLDCPICDQGGECDLQDQAMAYGFDRTRFAENKRAVGEKDMGPLIKTAMTRCIHCTRCVRFASEIAGVDSLGTLGRGEDMEIAALDATIGSELSGNLVDICPVGALTAKPTAFATRPWELKPVASIDVMDAVGAHIRIDTRGREVVRVLPRRCDGINEEWISDKTRHACDGLRRQRLDRPYLRALGGRLEACDWAAAQQCLADKLRAHSGDEIAALAGDLACAESIFALKTLLDALGCPHRDCRQDGALYTTENPCGYRFHTPMVECDQADALLLVGCYPRWEAPTLNIRLRRAAMEQDAQIASIGAEVAHNFPYTQLGSGPETLEAMIAGAHPFAQTLKAAERPVVIFGQTAFARPDGAAVHHMAWRLAEACALNRRQWSGYNFLHQAAARMAGLALGFLPTPGGWARNEIIADRAQLKLLFLLGCDEIEITRRPDLFIVYLGHHGDRGAAAADLVLPTPAYTEKRGLYINLEGRVQETQAAVTPPGQAQEDWRVILALMQALGLAAPFSDHDSLRQAICAKIPELRPGQNLAPAPWEEFGQPGAVAATPFAPPLADFYMTNAICRAAPTMLACLKEAKTHADARNSGLEASVGKTS